MVVRSLRRRREALNWSDRMRDFRSGGRSKGSKAFERDGGQVARVSRYILVIRCKKFCNRAPLNYA